MASNRQEFLLLGELCRSAFAGGAGKRAPMPDALDWRLFLRLARFHRVQGVIARGLRARHDAQARIPAPVARELVGDSTRIAAANLLMAEECRGLSTDFAAAAIPVLFVKGLTLGVVAYGDIATKAAVDIDLLVDEHRLADATALLEARSYRRIQPGGEMNPKRFAAWHALRKESAWRKRGSGLQVDLHTRLADNDRLIPGIGIASPSQTVEVLPGILLPTLAREELFAYLCVHGASSAWFRLKWICDLAALIEVSGQSLESLHASAMQQGAGRSAAQALLLADRLFGTLGAVPRLREELMRDGANRMLARIAFDQLAGKAEPREPTAQPFGTAAIHLSQLLLLPGPRFAAGELWRQGRAALLRP